MMHYLAAFTGLIMLVHYSGPADPAIRSWFSNQHDGLGGYCCDLGDGHEFYGDYKLDKDGSVEFDDGGKHHHMPAYKVLTGPNPTGVAIYWYLDSPQGRTDYCFALGTEG